MMNEPLISICIPTYNRVALLKKNIETILEAPEFDDEVEIVISDNCSTDETEIVCRAFAEKYRNIRYYRNEQNVRDENFWLVLNRASGKYRKLQNDRITLAKGGLKIIKDMIKKYPDRMIFYTGGCIKTNEPECVCEDINDFVCHVSTYTTLINIFGCWNKTLSIIEEPLRANAYMLNQQDWIYQILSKEKKSVLINYQIYKNVEEDEGKIFRAEKYKFYDVHLKNYYDIMSRFVGEDPFISKQTLMKDKDRWLRQFKMALIYTYVYQPPSFPFDLSGCSRLLWQYMRECPRLYLYMAELPFYLLLYPYYRICHGPSRLKSIWRRIKRRS